MTTAQKPDALPVVAWQYVSEDPLDGGQVMLSEEKLNRRTLWPLVRLSDAQASLLAKEAECEALREDAARLDWMDRNPGRIKHSTGYRGEPDSWIYTDDCGYGLDAANLRAAIDAARAAADQGEAS